MAGSPPRIIPLTSIPSLSSLYESGSLQSLPPSKHKHAASAALNRKIHLIQADITRLGVDAIVNAANKWLAAGAGVDGAIHHAAGPELQDECDLLDGCDPGDAKATAAYGRLPCKAVIHAVGPKWNIDDDEEGLLRSCYRTSLDIAARSGWKSVAFCAISTGVYGYPNGLACRTAVDEVRRFLESKDGEKLESVVFCNFMDVDQRVYELFLPYYFPHASTDGDSKTEDDTEKGQKKPVESGEKEQVEATEQSSKQESSKEDTVGAKASSVSNEAEANAKSTSEKATMQVNEASKPDSSNKEASTKAETPKSPEVTKSTKSTDLSKAPASSTSPKPASDDPFTDHVTVPMPTMSDTDADAECDCVSPGNPVSEVVEIVAGRGKASSPASRDAVPAAGRKASPSTPTSPAKRAAPVDAKDEEWVEVESPSKARKASVEDEMEKGQ